MKSLKGTILFKLPHKLWKITDEQIMFVFLKDQCYKTLLRWGGVIIFIISDKIIWTIRYFSMRWKVQQQNWNFLQATVWFKLPHKLWKIINENMIVFVWAQWLKLLGLVWSYFLNFLLIKFDKWLNISEEDETFRKILKIETFSSKNLI